MALQESSTDYTNDYTNRSEIIRDFGVLFSKVQLMQKEIWFLATLILLVAGGGWAMFTRIDDSLQRIDSRLVAVEVELARVDERLTFVEDRLTKIEDRLTGVEGRLTEVEDRLTGVEDRLTRVEGRLTGVEDRLTGVEKELTEVKANPDR